MMKTMTKAITMEIVLVKIVIIFISLHPLRFT